MSKRTITARRRYALGKQHGSNLGAANALTQCGGHSAMAAQAERAQVGQVALAAALHHRDDVVGVPEALTQLGLQAPVCHPLHASAPSGAAQAAQLEVCVHATGAAHAMVSREHLFSEVPRLGPQAPLVHTIRRAKGEAPRRHLQAAPAAQATAVWAAGHAAPRYPSALHGARGAHAAVLVRPALAAKWQRRFRFTPSRDSLCSPHDHASRRTQAVASSARHPVAGEPADPDWR